MMSETNTNVCDNEYKEVIVTIRVTRDQAKNIKLLMESMGIKQISKFTRKMYKVMIEHGKEKGII